MKQGIVKQQNLLGEVASKVRLAIEAVKNVAVHMPKDPSADLTKPVLLEDQDLVKTKQGEELLAAFEAAESLLTSRLLELSVVRAASTNKIGWATVEALSGSSWRDLCSDEKHASNVKDALAEQEKLAVTESEKSQRQAEKAGNKAAGRRPLRGSYQQPPAADSNASRSVSYYVPPPPAGAPNARPRAASAGMPAHQQYSASAYHAANNFCYKCEQPGHRSMNCMNAPAPGRF